MYQTFISLFSSSRLMLVGSLIVVASGCGEYGGGAAVVPDVTFLPPDLSGEASVDESSADVSEAGSASAGGIGSIEGRVKFVGTPPSLSPVYVKGADIKDKEVCAAVDVPDERLLIGADSGVANVFVYMKKAPKGAPAMSVPAEAIFFDQKYCRFIPHCMIVPVGQTVKVLSDDPIAHNTHTNPAKNNGISSVVPENDRTGVLELKYTRAEDPFSVTCDFHAWMKAFHLPVDHPYAAVTDADGNFLISDVPAGKHEFVVWHESANGQYLERRLQITVTGGESTKLEIPYSSEKLAL